MSDIPGDMTWAEKTIFKLKMVAFFLAIGCPVGIVWLLGSILHGMESERWPSVEGKIINVVAKPYQSGRNDPLQFYGRAIYEYSVDGKQYSSDLTNLGPGMKRADQFTALADVAQYEIGDKAPVFYNPADPAEGVLETGIPPNHLILFVVLWILFVVGLVSSILIVRNWRKGRAPPVNPADEFPDLSKKL